MNAFFLIVYFLSWKLCVFCHRLVLCRFGKSIPKGLSASGCVLPVCSKCSSGLLIEFIANKIFSTTKWGFIFLSTLKRFLCFLACVCYFINAKTPINVLYYIPEKCHYEVSNFAKICDTLVENILYVLFIGVHVNSTVLSAHFQRLALILQYIAFIRKRATV